MEKLIKLLGGYTKQEYQQKQDELDEWDDVKVLTQAVKHLFNTIGSEDILNFETLQRNGEPVSEQFVKNIQNEAKLFLKTTLWKEIKKSIKYESNKAMFEKAKNENDLTAGKLWLYTLDTIETRLKNLIKDR